MAHNGGTGNYVVNESFLTDFADQKLQKFIGDSATAQPMLALDEFATAHGGGVGMGNYSQLMPGGATKFAVAGDLQNAFKTYATNVLGAITGGSGIVPEVTKIQNDLRSVNQVLQQGESTADELSGTAMMTDLQDILGGNNPMGNSSSGNGTGNGTGNSNGGGSSTSQ